MKKWMLIAALVLGAGFANAQTPPPTAADAAIHTMVQHVDRQAHQFSFYSGDIQNWKQARAAAEQGGAHLKADIKPALAQAEGHADLIAAIKALYISANTYFDSVNTPVPLPTYDPRRNNLYASPEALALKDSQMKMKADVDAKLNAVKLEAELAGLAAG